MGGIRVLVLRVPVRYWACACRVLLFVVLVLVGVHARIIYLFIEIFDWGRRRRVGGA